MFEISIAEGKNPVGESAERQNPVTIGGVDGDNKIVGLVLNADGSITAKMGAGTEIAGKFIPVDADGDEKFTAANPASVQLIGSSVTLPVSLQGCSLPSTSPVPILNIPKYTIETLLNAVSIAALGNATFSISATTEKEIWLAVTVDKQPWSIAMATLFSSSGSASKTAMFPKRDAVATTHSSTSPALSIYMGVPVAATAGTYTEDVTTIEKAKNYTFPYPTTIAGRVENGHATDAATVILKTIRVWK